MPHLQCFLSVDGLSEGCHGGGEFIPQAFDLGLQMAAAQAGFGVVRVRGDWMVASHV